MDHRIRLLPDAIANQIAAGEVVQRPASVVKELLENAVDAGSTDIVLNVKEGGKTFIQVSDNGIGMSEIDARMCFERHATSKIAQFEDMQRLQTLGFRGEALASIAAVAQVELKTRLAQEEMGTRILIEGSETKLIEPVAMNVGTTFVVKNLFFNVPARRNFLKSAQVEQAHIGEEFYRVALANPEVSFSHYQAGVLIKKLEASNSLKRIISLFGDSYRDNLLPVKEETEIVKVSGFIGKPELSRKTRGDQYFFANGRFIKNGYLHHAVTSAFEGSLPQSSFPFYVLYFDIDPAKIDINVHPTKTEIKFENDRLIYSILQAAVRKALQTYAQVPTLDFEPPSPWFGPKDESSTAKPQSTFQPPAYSTYQPRPTENWQTLFGSNKTKEQLLQQFDPGLEKTTVSSRISDPSKPAATEKKEPFNLHGRYLLAQVKSGMLLIHMPRAWERILFERLLKQLETRATHSQQLLFPINISLSASDYALLAEIGPEIRKLGVDWEDFGGQSIVVRGLPPDAIHIEPQQLIQSFLEQFKWNKSHLNIPKNQSIAQALAKRAAQSQSYYSWKEAENESLIHQLFLCEVPGYTPDGKPISTLLSLDTLEQLLENS